MDGSSTGDGLTRRSFLGGTLSLGVLGSPLGKTTPPAADPVAAVGQTRRSSGFTLWCASGGLIDPEAPSDRTEVEAFADRCASTGVTRLIANGASRMLVETARTRSIETHSYVALNSHGGVRMHFAWSCEFIRPPIGTPEAKVILDAHRPIWSAPTAQHRTSDFARAHPELRGQNRGRVDEMQPYERLQLSPILPEMREHEIGRYLALLDESGAAGV